MTSRIWLKLTCFFLLPCFLRMTTFCVMKLLCHATRNENGYAKRLFGTLLTQTAQKGVFSPFCMVVPDPKKTTVFGLAQPFCTAEKSHREPKQKAAFGSVGRRIPYRILHVLNQDGESLGNMHRADALRLMDQHGLKLVLLRENVEPPVYRLMTGQQIHEEQLKRAEKKKASSKAGTYTVNVTTMNTEKCCTKSGFSRLNPLTCICVNPKPCHCSPCY